MLAKYRYIAIVIFIMLLVSAIWHAGYKSGANSDRDELYAEMQEIAVGFVNAKIKQIEVAKKLEKFRNRKPEIITKEIEKIVQASNCINLDSDVIRMLNEHN